MIRNKYKVLWEQWLGLLALFRELGEASWRRSYNELEMYQLANWRKASRALQQSKEYDNALLL